jgi:hypothetical protein
MKMHKAMDIMHGESDALRGACLTVQQLLLAAANRILPADIDSHWPPSMSQQYTQVQHRKTSSSATLPFLACYNHRLSDTYLLPYRTACPFACPFACKSAPPAHMDPQPQHHHRCHSTCSQQVHQGPLHSLCTVLLGVTALLFVYAPSAASAGISIFPLSSFLLLLPSSFIPLPCTPTLPQPHTLW